MAAGVEVCKWFVNGGLGGLAWAAEASPRTQWVVWQRSFGRARVPRARREQVPGSPSGPARSVTRARSEAFRTRPLAARAGHPRARRRRVAAQGGRRVQDAGAWRGSGARRGRGLAVPAASRLAAASSRGAAPERQFRSHHPAACARAAPFENPKLLSKLSATRSALPPKRGRGGAQERIETLVAASVLPDLLVSLAHRVMALPPEQVGAAAAAVIL